MDKSVVSRFFLIFSLLIGKLYAQCPTDADIKELVKKSNKLSASDNLSQLEKLYKVTQSCKNIQDSTRGELCNSLAYEYYNQNDATKALAYSKLAVKHWEFYANQMPVGLTYAAYGAAAYHHLLHNSADAIKYYNLTVKYALDPYWQGYPLKLISDLELELGDYEGMLNSLDKAQRFVENHNGSNLLLLMSQIHNSKGIAFSRLDNEKKAIESFELAQRFYQRYFQASKTENWEEKGNIYTNLGISYYNLKNFKLSESNFKKAEQAFSRPDLTYLLPRRIYNNLGILYTSFHRYKEASTLFNKSINAMKQTKNIGLARIYLNYSTNLYEDKQLDSAIKTLDKAIAMFPMLDISKQNFGAIRSKRSLFYILRDYAKYHLIAYQQSKKTAMLSRALQYFSYADQVLNLMRQEHQGRQSKSFWREHSHDFYEWAIEASRLANDPTKAFYFLEKSRAILLLDDLKENNARKLLKADEQLKEKKYQAQIIELQMQLESKSEKSAEYQAIAKKLSATKDQFANFIKNLERQSPAYYEAKYSDDFKNLSAFQQWLKANKFQTFVSYFVGDSATYAMKVTPTETKLIKIPKDKQNLNSRFLSFCSNIDSLNTYFPVFLSVSKRLYDTLIKPLGLIGDRLIISYDDSFLPFEALSKSSNKSDFLIQHFAISYAYSANSLLKSIEGKNQRSSWFNNVSFLGVAPVKFEATLPLDALALSAKSINNIKRIFNGKLLLEKDATKEQFINQFPDYRIVQMYTHADTTHRGPVFYLQDAPVYVSEISHKQAIHTEMIVLSACKTGLGKNIKGEGIFSLSRGFSALGIPSLITTLWSVDEKATYDVTELFYQNLKEGLPKDIALQKAKLAFISESTRNLLPNLWASSILIGDTTPIEQTNWWLIASLSTLFIITGTWLYVRYRQQ